MKAPSGSSRQAISDLHSPDFGFRLSEIIHHHAYVRLFLEGFLEAGTPHPQGPGRGPQVRDGSPHRLRAMSQAEPRHDRKLTVGAAAR